MKRLLFYSLAAMLAVAVLFLGCQELDVDNLNQPDEARALATPSDIEALVQGSFLTWFQSIQGATPSMSLAMPSDTYTCGWGNFGMSPLSDEPRPEFINTTSAGTAGVVEGPWFGLYGAISAASDGIRNIQSGAVSLGPNNERAIGFGKFVQGLSHGFIALMFDQGFVLDENVDLNSDILELKPYDEVMAAAVQQLEDAIAIFNANNFTIPSNWINGREYTSAELTQLAHSFIARYLVEVARDRTERTNVNWAQVLTHLDQGLTDDWGVTGDPAGRGSVWYSGTHWYAGDQGTWQRVDYKLIGPSDPSTAYQDWLSRAPADRQEFTFPTTDKRIWDGTLANDGKQNPGSQFHEYGPTTFIGGSYGFSRYSHDRFNHIFQNNNGGFIALYRASEHDFLRAEALLNTGGSLAEVAALLDKTHVNDGGYPSTAGLPAGSISDTPQPQHDKGATLWSVLKYEKNMDLLGTFSGLQYWEKRGWGELTTGTMIHFPVPAQDLETLQLALYTFGGVGGVDSAPKGARRYGEDPSELRLRR